MSREGAVKLSVSHADVNYGGLSPSIAAPSTLFPTHRHLCLGDCSSYPAFCLLLRYSVHESLSLSLALLLTSPPLGYPLAWPTRLPLPLLASPPPLPILSAVGGLSSPVHGIVDVRASKAGQGRRQQRALFATPPFPSGGGCSRAKPFSSSAFHARGALARPSTHRTSTCWRGRGTDEREKRSKKENGEVVVGERRGREGAGLGLLYV